MKKLFILISVLLLTGCTTSSLVDDFYTSDLKELENSAANTSLYDYDLNIYLEPIGEEYLYQLVLDNPTTEIDNLKVLLIHDAYTDEVYPSYGYFGDNMDNTVEFKGLNLIGYLTPDKPKIEFKVLVTYDDVRNFHIITLDR